MKIARQRRSTRIRSAAVLAIIALLVGLLAGGPTAGAKGDDVCPEPNDAFQQACYLGPASDAIGFISRPDDIDAYRFEVRDFGAKVHFALDDRPLPYRVSLANYNGEVVA